MKQKPIQWSVVKVDVAKIKPTPNNFKLKTEDGSARFETSVDTYGLAGAVILNADYTLIDGNTRVEKAKLKGIKKLDASMPNRKLTPKEFSEFSAMYDMARAGEVDVLRIKQELGTTESFFKKWGFELPSKSLKKLAELEKNEAVINPTKVKGSEAPKAVELARLTLLFTPDECEEYLRVAESMYKYFKVDNVTDLALKALRFAKKQIK